MMIDTRPNMSRETTSRLFWGLLPLLLATFILKDIDKSNVGFAALFMNKALGFTPFVYGTGAGIFFLGYVVTQIPASLFVLRIGARRSMAWMMLAWGILAMLTAFIHSPLSFYALRFALGVAESGFQLAITLYVSLWFPRRQRATSFSWLYGASALSVIIGAPISGAILELPSFLGLAPWQWLFIIEGLPTVLLAFLVLNYVADTPQEAHWLTPAQRDELAATLETDTERHAAPRVSSGFAAAKDWRLWALILVYMCMAAFFYAMLLWLPQIVKHLTDVRPFYVGLITAAPFVLTICTMVAVGRHSDKTGKRYPYVVGCMLSGSILLVASAYFTSIPLLSLLLLIIGIPVFEPATGPFLSFATEFLDGQARALGIALLTTFGSTAGFFATSLIGWLREEFGSFQAAIYVMSGVLLVGACLMYVIGQQQERSQAVSVAVPT